MVWHSVSEGAACLRYSTAPSRGVEHAPFEEFACLYPDTFGKTYQSWEYGLDRMYQTWEVMDANPYFPLIVCAFYVVAIFSGQAYMKNRPAWKWRKTLAFWNLLLSVFSTLGFFRTFPVVAHNLYHYGLYDSVCTSPYTAMGDEPTVNWAFVFALSKFAELFDTFFIVIHKKKLMFLHWYHHITVLYACWHAWVNEAPIGLIFCAMNYGVHSIMYFYYFLMAVRCKPKWFNPMVITVAQILQMVVGVTFTFLSLRFVGNEGCLASEENIKGTLFMYATYLLLFLQFFFQRYGFGIVAKKPSSKKAKKL